jgi:hypothetical protein
MRRYPLVLIGAALLFGLSVTAGFAADPPPEVKAAAKACLDKGIQPNTVAYSVCMAQQLGQPPPSPREQAAMQACLDKGLTPNTAAFTQCVQQQLSSSKPPLPPSQPQQPPTPQGPGSGGTATPAQKAAIQTCLAQGLKPNTPALNQCTARLLMPAKQRDAYDACTAQGLQQGTDPFMQCVQKRLNAGNNNPPLTPRQQDSVDFCLGKGLVQGTDAFKTCLKTAGKSSLNPKQQAAVDACQAKGALSDAALAKCVADLLKVEVPAPQGANGPKPAEIQAAFTACTAKGLKPPSDAFEKCVKTALANP